MPLPLLSNDSATMVLICSPGGSMMVIKRLFSGSKFSVFHILASDTESDVRHYEDFNANNAFAGYLCKQQQHLKLRY